MHSPLRPPFRLAGRQTVTRSWNAGSTPALDSTDYDCSKEKDSADLVDPLSPKDSSSLSTIERVYKLLPSLSHWFKKKYQAHIDKIRMTFSQVKINIPSLSVMQIRCYVRFLKDLCTTN